MRSVAILITHSPFGDSSGHDALDMSMVLGTFEVDTAIFFMSDAVNQLRALKTETFNLKDFTKSFAALPFYDVEQLFACRQSLQKWQIKEDTLIDAIHVLDEGSITEKLAQFDRVITF